jgi:hypothetical protein
LLLNADKALVTAGNLVRTLGRRRIRSRQGILLHPEVLNSSLDSDLHSKYTAALTLVTFENFCLSMGLLCF